jgi:alpha-beta hydrolase superfamily lysophospholipase
MGRARVAVIVVMTAAVLAAGCSDGGSSGSPTTVTTQRGRVRLIASGGLRGVLGRERSAEKSSATTAAPTTTTFPVAPFAVAQTSATFLDPSRGSPARGGTSAQPGRTIATSIYYPSSIPPTADAPTPAPAAGTFPLVVFAHGYEIDAAAYAPMLRDLAVGGYVVAAPDFPGTSTAYPGGAIREDALQQPADISFVITSMLQLSDQPGLLHGAISPTAIGVSGHSDGAVTALAAGYNTCCLDSRIKAGAILSGATFGFDGEWFPPGTPPVMFVHATADEINDYDASLSMFDRAQSPKYLLTIEGGSHLEVFVDPPWEPQIAQATISFFDLYLKGDQGAAAQLQTIGNQPGLTTLQQG